MRLSIAKASSLTPYIYRRFSARPRLLRGVSNGAIAVLHFLALQTCQSISSILCLSPNIILTNRLEYTSSATWHIFVTTHLLTHIYSKQIALEINGNYKQSCFDCKDIPRRNDVIWPPTLYNFPVSLICIICISVQSNKTGIC